jgi:hypothetical protein
MSDAVKAAVDAFIAETRSNMRELSDMLTADRAKTKKLLEALVQIADMPEGVAQDEAADVARRAVEEFLK